MTGRSIDFGKFGLCLALSALAREVAPPAAAAVGPAFGEPCAAQTGGGHCRASSPQGTDDTGLLQASSRPRRGGSPPAEPRQMKLHLMEDKGLDSDVGAVCLDGSPGAFYFSPGVGEQRNDWLIFMEGGGWCTTPWDCFVGRANTTWPTSLGSSKGYEPIAPAWMNKGINSLNCTISPFCNFSQVFVRYCDGTSFSGNLDEPVVLRDSNWNEFGKVYFRGQRIFDAVVDTLLQEFGLNVARRVLFSGCSAGGLAATLHADYLHDRLMAAVPNLQKYATAPTSGFFLKHDNVLGEPIYPAQMQQLFTLSNWTMLSPRCAAANPSDPRKCNFAQYAAQHIESPFFLINSALDWWQTRCILADEQWNNGACQLHAGYECASNITECVGSQLSAMNGYMDSFMDALAGVVDPTSKPGNGAFISGCHFHCEGQEDVPFTTFRINGVTMKDAVYQWWQGEDTAAVHTHKEQCRFGEGVGCNPSCYVFTSPF
mmetsp:Transcript_87162/g.260009  ORF Transcript_87162/g.260009 Transcript_87162/m.260009 type:complete len:485 (+) Transcript_87162:68-1522(+)